MSIYPVKCDRTDASAFLCRYREPSDESVLLDKVIEHLLVDGHVRHVCLVGKQYKRDILVVGEDYLVVDVFLPLENGIEGSFTGQIENENSSDRKLVIDTRHRSKTFVASNIPDLQCHILLIVVIQNLRREIYADCEAVLRLLQSTSYCQLTWTLVQVKRIKEPH